MGPNLEAAAEAVRKAGWADRCWLVGGAVRDDLLGGPESEDIDIVVLGDAVQAARDLFDQGIADGPPAVYARFGTAMVRVGPLKLEFASSRAESYSPGSRKPNVRPASLDMDAYRRDFTVNTLLRSTATGELADPLGTGLADLSAQVLRTPGDPVVSFADDPLRLYRAVRFRWKLDFEYAEVLPDAIRREAHRTAMLSAERVRDELSQILMLQQAGAALDEAESFGLLARVSPEFAEMRKVGVGKYHHLDAWAHTCRVVDATPFDLATRLAAWLHDIGKPATAEVQGDKVTFYGHETVGADMARDVLHRLRFPEALAATVEQLVRGHMRFSAPQPPGPAGLRRVVRDFGEDVGRLLDLVEADRSALRPGFDLGDVEELRRRLEETARATPQETLESPLSGQEVIRLLDLSPGPEVGAWKRALAEAVLEGEVPAGDKEAAESWLLETRNRLNKKPVSDG
ncbi:MAG: CCA tRNA nucleotidyltransferase [Fimbriimonadaceae bacterium]